MKNIWRKLPFFWKLYSTYFFFTICIICGASYFEDLLPQLLFDRKKTLDEATAILATYIGLTENKERFVEEARGKGIWLWDGPVSLLEAQKQPGEPLSVVGLLPQTDDWQDDWIFVQKILPDRRLVAVGMRDPTSVDFMEPLLWFVAISVISGASCACLSWLLTVRLRNITGATQELSRGDLSVRLPDEQDSKDEFSLLSRAFNSMVKNMASLVENERRLLCDISHELRGPLARMHLAAALMDSEDGVQTKKYLALLQEDLNRMGIILEGIIDERANRVAPDDHMTEQVDMHAVLCEAVKLANFEFQTQQEKAVLVTPSTCAGVPAILGVRTLLEQALYNVIINGLRYTKAGSEVELRMQREEEGLVITVRDYGPGVPEASLSKLFRPFFRVEEARDRHSGSVGLGLSLARHYIEMHNGKITAFNAGPGLCVRIVMALP